MWIPNSVRWFCGICLTFIIMLVGLMVLMWAFKIVLVCLRIWWKFWSCVFSLYGFNMILWYIVSWFYDFNIMTPNYRSLDNNMKQRTKLHTVLYFLTFLHTKLEVKLSEMQILMKILINCSREGVKWNHKNLDKILTSNIIRWHVRCKSQQITAIKIVKKQE